MHLLERDQILARIHELVTDARTGHGSLVFLTGEAGIGKTSVVRTLRQTLEPEVRVLIGACDPIAAPRPLAPIVDIAPLLGDPIQSFLIEGANVHDIYRAVVAELSDPGRPALIVLEDMHWADDASLDLLRYVGRRISATRGVLLATYRDDEVHAWHPLRSTLGDLATADHVERIHIPRLSQSAVRALVADQPVDAGNLFALTNGNPFFVTEVLAANQHGIPETVADAVLTRASRMSVDGRRALSTAAVMGSPLEPWILLAAAGVDPQALDDCVEHGMLLADGAMLSFRHEIAREAVLSTISPALLMGEHARILGALLESTASDRDPARLANHAEGARDGPAVLLYAIQAAERAQALNAHREVAAQYRRAARFATHLAPAELAPLLERLSFALFVIDDWAESLAQRDRALEIYRKLGDIVRLGDNQRWRSRLLWVSGRGVEANVAARESISTLESQRPGPELAMAYSNLSQLTMLANDVDETLIWGQKAIDLATALGNPAIVAHATNNVGSALCSRDFNTGFTMLQHALDLAQQADVPEHIARSFTNLTTNAIVARRFDLAAPYLEEGIAYSFDRDLDFNRWYMTGWKAIFHLRRGQWQEAAEIAAPLITRHGIAPISKISGLYVLALVRARRGDPESDVLLDEAFAYAQQTGELQRLAPVYAARAEIAWLRGDSVTAVAEASAIYAEAIRLENGWYTGEFAYWKHMAGAAVILPPVIAEPYALDISGQWQQAAQAWDKLECPLEAARSRYASTNEADLRDAWAILDRLGASADKAILVRRMRQLNIGNLPRGARPSTKSNPANLTDRELDVLRLVVQGQTNTEIAEKLYLSPKTIERHLGSAMGKLGINSRRDVQAALLVRGVDLQFEG